MRGKSSSAAPRAVLVLAAVAGLCTAAAGADWPQFMRNSEHQGDALDEILKLPLGLATCVRLDDAILASPAVVGGRVYVVDQMGTAYCVDPRANRVLWKTSPEGPAAMGGNASSPCLAGGRLYFGTTAGQVHVLDAANGKILHSLDVHAPVTGSLTFAHDSIYFQTLGAEVIRLDCQGSVIWRYDHDKDLGALPPFKEGHALTLAVDKPMHGGGEVAVQGGRVVANLGWHLVCLEETGGRPRVAWCNRNPLHGHHRGSGTSGHGVFMGPSIGGPWVYAGFPGVDTFGDALRLRMEDGRFDPSERLQYELTQSWRPHWAVFATAAVRGDILFAQSHLAGMMAQEFGKGTKWRAFRWAGLNLAESTPGIASAALSKDHCVFATVRGEVYVVPIEGSGEWGGGFQPAPFRFATPSGRCIASSPVIADGSIYFGTDDGCLYGLSPGGTMEPALAASDLHRPRSKAVSPTGKKYAWPGPYGSQANSNYVDDPGFKPPLRLRWAIRSGAAMKLAVSASEEDVFSMSMEGTLAAVEQQTGRIRWRKRLPGSCEWFDAVLYDRQRLFVARSEAGLLCLDASDGSVRWSAPVGKAVGVRPVLCGGVVAYAAIPAEGATPVLQGYDAETGQCRWKLEFNAYKGKNALVTACVLDDRMFFSCGAWDEPGVTVAVEPRSGKVLWRNADFACDNRTAIAAYRDRIYITGFRHPMACLAAKDGSVLWSRPGWSAYRAPTLGPDFFTTRGYGGGGEALDLDTGRTILRDRHAILTGGPDHTCGPAVLTASGLSLAVTVSGLHVRDLAAGRIVWSSRGFSPRACANVTVASGRVFYQPQNGMLYCFEPAGE